MPLAAAAVIGSAVIGAAASKNAADKQAAGVKKSIDSTNSMADRSRADAMNFYSLGDSSARNAQQGAMDFYKSTNQAPSNAYTKANMLGQQAIGQGYQQANNAILGLPVDMSFANNPQAITGDYSAINAAQLPAQAAAPLGAQMPQKPQATESPAKVDKLSAIASAGGYAANPLDKKNYTLKGATEIAANGGILFGDKLKDSYANPVAGTKKLLKKLF